MQLADIQSQHDDRNLYIDKVGIKDIQYPIVVKDRKNGKQSTVAKINMYVKLPHNFKGTHMSRFVEVLNNHRTNIGIESFRGILDDLKNVLESEESHIEITFPYFMEKYAPVSKLPSLMDYECSFFGSSYKNKKDFIVSVKVPVISVCPCSKEISRYGAHNQRSYIIIKVRYKGMIWIEDLIEMAENSASSPIFSLLKREDEKFVTECSYENPVFVEDIVRNVADKLLKDDRVTWFEVSSENQESIHNHSAYAEIVRDKR
ncbi:MAG: GTP cyclohydrolase FolE2 [Calditerrivibrio sp.]|nr:GTP cyclohydrolase FolE2 [Calditerrivibrio sp.]MCA1933040.1 GTP cyclohydrolase FolE2 [Calditerrivibrio sp.]MCA1980657.1 GTP cyclohydrolase FolE2 [Calditerrivibrio sp.]